MQVKLSTIDVNANTLHNKMEHVNARLRENIIKKQYTKDKGEVEAHKTILIGGDKCKHMR
jgi:hypothetical protein